MARQRKPQDKPAKYGAGSILANQDGTFTAQVYIHGKPVRRRAASRQEAEAIREELNRQKKAKVDVIRGGQAVEDFTAYWFPEVYLQSGVSTRGAKHTLDMLELHILPIIGRRPLNQVTHEELQQLLNNLRRRPGKRPLSAQTVHHVHSVLRPIFSKAKQMRLIEDDPTVGLVLPKINRAERAAPTVEQVRRLLAVVEGHPYSIAIHLMATFGLRLGEALAVRRTDFSDDFSEVYIQQAADYHTHEMGNPKRDSKRRLPVPAHLAQRCRAQWERILLEQDDPTPMFQNQGLLCPSERGTVIQSSNFEKAWRGYTSRRKRKKGLVETYYPGFRDKAKLPSLTTHDLRRFVATTLEGLDVGQRTIGHILGHGAKNITELYIKRELPTMRRALEKLERELWGDDQKSSEIAS